MKNFCSSEQYERGHFPKMPEMMELAKKDVKTAIINMLYMFKMIEGNINMKRKEVSFFKTQMDF